MTKSRSEPPVTPIGTYSFKATDWDYRFEWEEGVRVLVDRIHEERGDVLCEITIECVEGEEWTLLHGPAKLNLIADRTLGQLAKALGERVELDWVGLLTQVKAKSIQQYRQGSPLIRLADVTLSDGPRYLLPPFIYNTGVSTLVADGGTGKSLVAVACLVAVCTGEPVLGEYPNLTGPCVYLDWEADEETHYERLAAICAGLGMPIPTNLYYQSMVGSLSEAIATMRKKVASVDAVLVASDSTGMARGDEPNSADSTIKLFRAFRSLYVPVLAVDHVSKEQRKEGMGGGADPIGSIYTRNASRLVWSAEGNQLEGSDDKIVIFRNSKANFGRKEPQRSYRFRFESDAIGVLRRVTFEPVDWRETEEFQDRVPDKDRILRVLKDGKATVATLAEVLSTPDRKVTESVVRARLKELKESGKVLKLGDDWALSYFKYD